MNSFQLAQLVEQLTVNQRVAGSSPALGAKSLICELFCVLLVIKPTTRVGLTRYSEWHSAAFITFTDV
jgi:hypothetical protein